MNAALQLVGAGKDLRATKPSTPAPVKAESTCFLVVVAHCMTSGEWKVLNERYNVAIGNAAKIRYEELKDTIRAQAANYGGNLNKFTQPTEKGK